jgi:hypothetical protein
MAARHELRNYIESLGHDPAKFGGKASGAIYGTSKYRGGRQALRKR